MKKSTFTLSEKQTLTYEYDCAKCGYTHNILRLEVKDINEKRVEVDLEEMDLLNFIDCPIIVRIV